MTVFEGGLVTAAAAQDNPVADPRATVVSEQARFTVLTPRLIRLEWAADGRFEDRASLVFLNRRLPVPAFKVGAEGGWLTIETASLKLKYRKHSGRFAPRTLEVRLMVNGQPVVWRPGTPDTGNLGGTIRTLDGVKGSTPLEPGLVSRDGWVVVDDSARPLFDTSEWPWVMSRSDRSGAVNPLRSGVPGAGASVLDKDRQDWYFFGYGHDYSDVLRDFTRVAGKIPMPPRFAFGTWWSRYWAYTDGEFKGLVLEFEIHDVPLDVLVIDMDWHLTFTKDWRNAPRDQAGERLGWTGYTWNKVLFPDPAGFLRWADRKGLKTPLNLHPASGIQPHEEQYPAMARAMGIDPATKKYVAFDIVDKRFTQNYLDLLIHSLEAQGVDFWWLDWQQWSTTQIPGVTPTWWLNYVFFTDMERRGKARPLLFHRWGGLGNHRYQIGFSGDTISVWESLAFQPNFTATAANVGFGYWSHDIGGHMPGVVSPELYTRWVQYGVFSPILRTHTTQNPEAERRIWAYPLENFYAMREAFLLRYALIPYIYTASRHTYDTGLSLARPLYYAYPEADEAYRFTDEYLFGDDMLVAPITAPMSADSLLASKRVWLPPGDWIEWFTGARVSGPATLERTFALEEIPVYVKAGAIIPMQPKMRHAGEKPVDPLVLTIFPGPAGTARVYEDEGNSLGYQKDEYAWTTVRHRTLDDGTKRVEILAPEGRYPGMPSARGYELRFPGAWPPDTVSWNGSPISFSADVAAPGWRYDGQTLTTIVTLPRTRLTEKVEVSLKSATPPAVALLDGARGKLVRLRRAMDLLNGNTEPTARAPESLIDAVQAGNRTTLNPKSAVSELEKLNQAIPLLIDRIAALGGDPAIRARALNHISGLLK